MGLLHDVRNRSLDFPCPASYMYFSCVSTYSPNSFEHRPSKIAGVDPEDNPEKKTECARLNNLMVSLEEKGDAAFRKGNFHLAASQYKAAFDKLHAGSQT